MSDFDLNFHSIDSVIAALYNAISGASGAERDWDCITALFTKDAHMVRTSIDKQGKPRMESLTVAEYQMNAQAVLKDIPFYEHEIGRHTERFGNVASVLSAYEAKSDLSSDMINRRGMNMLHMYDDGERWWIMHMIWDNEREGLNLPGYLML